LIGVANDGSYIISSNNDKKLYKYTFWGDELSSVDISHDGPVYDVYVDDHDVIFVCLDDNVIIYDKTGKQISLLSTDRQIEPSSVFVDRNRQIFVCDY